MQTITDAVRAMFDAGNRQVARITGTDSNGNSINITEANIMQGGLVIDRYSCVGNRLEIGTAVAAQLTLKLDNRNGQFNSIKFEGAELFVEVGVADWEQAEPEITYIPCGYFTPDEQPRSQSIITIHALDRMMKFDRLPAESGEWVTEGGDNITDESANPIVFMEDLDLANGPEICELVERICEICEVPLEPDHNTIRSYVNGTYRVYSLPKSQEPITYRKLIQWCAGIMARNAYIDWDGKLRFNWYNNAPSPGGNYQSNVQNRFSGDIYENEIEITGIKYTQVTGGTIVYGSTDYMLDMTGNYLMSSGVATILPNILPKVAGTTVFTATKYKPFTLSAQPAPYIWPMDWISYRTGDDTAHLTIATNVNYTLNGRTVIGAKGETAQTNYGTQPDGLTEDQALLVDRVTEMNEQLDESLDQDGIFDRLTNNGAAQGIYLQNGQLYINGTYMRIGTIKGQNNPETLFDLNNGEIVTAEPTAQGGHFKIGIKDGAITFYYLINDSYVEIGSLFADVIYIGSTPYYTIYLEALQEFDIDGNTVVYGRLNQNGRLIINGDVVAVSNDGGSSYHKGYTGSFIDKNSNVIHVVNGLIVDGYVDRNGDDVV